MAVPILLLACVASDALMRFDRCCESEFCVYVDGESNTRWLVRSLFLSSPLSLSRSAACSLCGSSVRFDFPSPISSKSTTNNGWICERISSWCQERFVCFIQRFVWDTEEGPEILHQHIVWKSNSFHANHRTNERTNKRIRKHTHTLTQCSWYIIFARTQGGQMAYVWTGRPAKPKPHQMRTLKEKSMRKTTAKPYHRRVETMLVMRIQAQRFGKSKWKYNESEIHLECMSMVYKLCSRSPIHTHTHRLVRSRKCMCVGWKIPLCIHSGTCYKNTTAQCSVLESCTACIEPPIFIWHRDGCYDSAAA